jgi:hypothetical protein
VRKGIFDPSVGSSAEEGFWPSDARTVQALLCTALLSALFFSWLWQAFRLYSCLTTMKPGNCFTCRCSRGSHCLLTASGCGSVLRNKSRAKDTCSPFLGARAYGAGL